MPQISPALSPEESAIIQCLRVFAQRGLAVRQEQAGQSKTVNVVPLAGETLTAERLTPAKESQP
jgi:hypothetical protein